VNNYLGPHFGESIIAPIFFYKDERKRRSVAKYSEKKRFFYLFIDSN
jgi:hypothetical protein